MTRRMTARSTPRPGLGALTLLAATGLLALAATGCTIVPEPVPGQPMTAEQKAMVDRDAATEMHERRRQDRPCGPNDCTNH